MPCGLGFHVGDLRDGLDVVQCAWAWENRPCKGACDAAFPEHMPASAAPSLKSLCCPKLRPLPAVQESIGFLSVVPAPAASVEKHFLTTNGHLWCFLNGGSDALRAGVLSDGICGTELDFVQGAWAWEQAALQASLRCRFPEAHARLSGAVPQISLLSQTAAIARSSRIY